jgi:hypothetical protein
MSSFAEPMEDSLALELVGRAGVEPESRRGAKSLANADLVDG